MGLFGNSTDASIQEEVERATSDKLVEEDWSLIMNICDKAGKSSEDSKAWLRAIVKRLYNPDPHIALKAATLLDASVKNSGKTFHVEVASKEFETDFTKLMTKAHPQAAKTLRESLKRWAENEFKSDTQLSLIPSLYHKLRSTYDFSSSETPIKKPVSKSTDPNVVETQEEEDQIAKAIELSLKEASGSPRNTAVSAVAAPAPSSLYPAVNNLTAFSSATGGGAPAKEARRVRALYDFEAAEDNELTFSSGEIIMVLDDTDPNWWKGSNQRGEGLFPANFVTADLSVEPEKLLFEKAKKMVQFKDEVKVLEQEPQEIEINEGKIDRLLHLLHEADPTNPEADTDELLGLEREVNAMGPLIDSELERVDRKHAQLTQLSADLVEALSLYHTLMREPQFPTLPKSPYDHAYGYAPPPTPSVYNGGLPPGMQQHMQTPPAYSLPGPPGLPTGVQERLPYNPYSMRSMPPPQNMQPNLQGGTQLPIMGGVHPSQQQVGMPSIIPNIQTGPHMAGGMPPNFQPMIDDRRLEGGISSSFQQGIPNYGGPSLSQPTFQSNAGSISQTSLHNGPAQQPPYATSDTHTIH